MSQFNKISQGCAVLVVVLGLYGSISEHTPWPALLSIAFASAFALAQHRAAGPQRPMLQLPLVLSLVALSFALHIAFLPAGICCFFCLMFCKNEMLLPSKQRPHAA